MKKKKDRPLTCAFGEPWGPGTAHPLCEAWMEQGIQDFEEAVKRGEYDADGYTPAERRAQAKRQRQQLPRLFDIDLTCHS